jgi:hypothetical protein
MPAPVNAPLAPFFSLTNGYTIRVSALDAATGAVVSDVVASDVSIAVDPGSPDGPGVTVPKVSPSYFQGV